MVNLGVATDLTAEDSATAIAKMANITGMATDEYSKFGASLTALGNNFATQESEILNMATRLSSTGDLVGLNEYQILAL
jgi:TP901 family phage tail tape measure protein